MNIVGDAQVVSESLVAINGVEISELGIDVELQQEGHLSFFGSFPDYDSISITIVVDLWCANGSGLFGSTCQLWRRRRGIQRGIRCGSLTRGRLCRLAVRRTDRGLRHKWSPRQWLRWTR